MVVSSLTSADMVAPRPDPREICCSFCHKPQEHGKRLVAGPSVYICEDCSDAVANIVETGRLKECKHTQYVKELCELTVIRSLGNSSDEERVKLQSRIDEVTNRLMPRRRYHAGDRVGTYQLVRIVGSGNFATVWEAVRAPSPDLNATGSKNRSGRANDPLLGPTKAAVKIFDAEKLGVGVMLWRFQRGIRAMERLSSLPDAPKSVVRFFSASEDRLSFAMQYLPGGDLHNIKARGWSDERKLKCFDRLTEALSFAHSHGIIHRDVKPANIVIDEGGHAVLTDFDIADLLFAPTRSVHASALGTPQFAAPEQLEGSVLDARPTADIYSLGKLLYYLFTESPPPLGSITDNLVPPYLLKLPPQLVPVVGRAMHENPAKRQQTVDELRHDVAQARSHGDHSAVPSNSLQSPATRTPKVSGMQTPENNQSFNPRTALVIGASFGAAGLLFIMTLIVMSTLGRVVPPNDRFLIIMAFALIVASSGSFLGGGAGADGRLPLPFAKEHPVKFGATGGAALFVIVLILGWLLFI